MKWLALLSILTISLLAACGGRAAPPGTPSEPRAATASPAPTGTPTPTATVLAATASPVPTGTPTPTATVLAATASPVPTTTVAPSPSATAADTRIEVSLTEMAIDPNLLVVPVGQPVTFVVTNEGVIEHEFFIGDENEQVEHEKEMASGGMAHGHGTAVTVGAGATAELTVTFDKAGSTLAGCHVPGHYPAGMKATIEIRGS